MGIRHGKPQPVADIATSISKSHKISTVQNDTENSMDYPVPKQLITEKAEVITKRTIQDKNR